MKTNYKLFFFKVLGLVFFLLLGHKIFAQTIKNGNFEAWDTTIYKEALRKTSNYKSLTKFGQASVFAMPLKSGHPGDSGARVKTKINGNDTVIGFITDATQLPNPIHGGCRCINWVLGGFGTQIKYKYTTQLNDSAYFLAVYIKNGVVLVRDSFALPKTNGIVEKTLSFGPVFNASNYPDSTIVYLSSSLPYRTENIDNSSELEIYQIFVGPNARACGYYLTGWGKFTYFNLLGWYQFKGFGEISQNTYLGNGALSLTGRINESGAFEGFGIRNYQTKANGNPVGGAAFSNKTDTLIGYYKFKGNGSANAKIKLMLFSHDSLILETVKYFFPPLNPYQYFEIPFNTSIQPDTLRIEISSADSSYNKIGDTLFIDELQLASSRLNTGLPTNNFPSASTIQWYPNPVNDLLYLNSAIGNISIQKLQVMDIQGKVLLELEIINGSIPPIPFSGFSPGVYVVNTYLNDDRIIKSKIVKQ